MNEVLDKIKNRLDSWKANTLSLAGRAVLIKSVTSSIPIYPMQLVKFPSTICEEIDRNFLWQDSVPQKKVHLANWDLLCTPKIIGGLGIKKVSMDE